MKYYIITISIITLIIYIIYYAIYSKLQIKQSWNSFLSFIINILILLSYLYGIIILLFYLPTPIFVSDLSSFSHYRYLFFIIIFLFTITALIFSYTNPSFNKFLSSINNISFLKNDFIIIIQKMDSIGLFFDKTSNAVINLFIKSKKFRFFYFFSHFTIFYFYRLILVLFFIKFTFFHGDLRLILYLIPTSFVIWLLSFIIYYFNSFFEDNYNYCTNLLNVKLKNNEPYILSNKNLIITDQNSLNFNLEPLAYKENFSEKDLTFLKNSWFKLINIKVYFIKYNYYTNLIKYIIMILYTICWFKLCFCYFYLNNVKFLVNPFGFGSFFKRNFHATSPTFARKGFWLKHEHDMNSLLEKTNGAYSPGHGIWADENPLTGNLEAKGSFTHDSKNKQPKAKEIDSSTDIKGNSKPQKGIPFEKPVEIPADRLTEIPYSQEYCGAREKTFKTLESSATSDTSKD